MGQNDPKMKKVVVFNNVKFRPFDFPENFQKVASYENLKRI